MSGPDDGTDPVKLIEGLRRFAADELYDNLLPFWSIKTVDRVNGGFAGSISQEGVPRFDSPKGLILNARILYSFSAVYNFNGEAVYLDLAGRAYSYITGRFADSLHGGFYWMVDAQGRPLETRKQTYALAFVIYAFSEYYRACRRQEVLDGAIALFRLIGEKCHDTVNRGYFEAFSSDWQPVEDMRLSEKDMNESKTMNTHLHVLEAFCNLLQVWDDDFLRERLRRLVMLFFEHIIDARTFHLGLFFNDEWESRSGMISYGHDIEAAWLLFEAARIAGDSSLQEQAGRFLTAMAEAAAEGIVEGGGLIHERGEGGESDGEMEWWAQAEAVTGFLHAYGVSGEKRFLQHATGVAGFISALFVDRQNGEWFYRLGSDGKPLPGYDKAGFWKCPYHNIRMCLEIMKFKVPGS